MRLVAIALLLGSATLSSAAFADEPRAPTEAEISEARERYARGRQLFQEGAFDAALAELERAYALAPTPALLYNLGLVHVARKDYSSALSAYEGYLRDETEPAAERRDEVEREVARLKPRVAELVLVAEDGAELFVDDVAVGTAPLVKAVRVNAGRRHVRAVKAGRSQSLVITVAGAERKELKLNVAPAPELRRERAQTPVGPARTPSADSGAREQESPSYLWIGWVATGVLAAGAVASGVVAYSASNELDDQTKTSNTSRAELDDTHDRMRTFAIAADILGAAALVTGGVTLYLSMSQSERSAQTAGVNLELGPSGVRVRGSF